MLKFSDFRPSCTQVFGSILEVAFSSGDSRWTCSWDFSGWTRNVLKESFKVMVY